MNKKYLLGLIVLVVGIIIATAFVIYVNLPQISPKFWQVNQEKAKEQTSKGPETSSSQQIAQKVINYINQNILKEQGTASLISVIEENGVYKLKFKIGERELETYVTKDGKLLFPTVIDLSSNPSKEEENLGETPKRDIPDVKLFVMSYCPFGLQAQKMLLPVYNLLKDKAEMEVYFVNYIMHGKQEIDENLRQYCIQKEQKSKYYNYLSCFVKDGNFEKCLSETKINKETLESCVSETDKKYKITEQYNDKSTWLNGKFPKFDVHSDLNEKYGVGGSPTIVINDKVIEVSPRSPEKLKETICQAFTSQPPECSQALSNDSPASGFGIGQAGSGGSGGCGQ